MLRAAIAAFLAAGLMGCGRSENARPAGRDGAGVTAEPTERASDSASSDVPQATAGDPPLESTSSLAGPAEEPASASVPQPVYRPSDVRPRHDVAMLERHGIRTFESKRLRLHTDIDPEIARTLPPYLDAAYEAWVEYFGALPPNREGTDYQVTAYLMADKELFGRLGLLPADLPWFINGRHRGAEFWMNEQKEDYYRRHLLIHEATHCFMTALPDMRAPVWYMEGMAELFGAHRIGPDGKLEFRVMPENRIDYAGFGRIDMVRKDVAAGEFQSLRQVTALEVNDFVKNEPYAWSWALCQLLDAHPRYRRRFRRLGGHLTGNQFERTFRELFGGDLPELQTDWDHFANTVQEGYDFERAAIDYRPARSLTAGENAGTIAVQAGRGWQSSGVRIEPGQAYEISAEGRFTLAQQPKPWISEPQGVSIRYFDGQPLGKLLAAVRESEEGSVDGNARSSLRDVTPIGRGARFVSGAGGTLYLRVNDSWSELADNAGAVEVRIREVKE